MRGPQIVRLIMVVLFVAMLATVVVLWRGPADDVAIDTQAPPDTPPGVVSQTFEPRYTDYDNGIIRYEVSAARALVRAGNRSEYDGGVELRLYSIPKFEGGPQDVTVVTADRLELVERDVPVEGDTYQRVRLLDNVRAILPQGEEFEGDVLTYADGELTTNRGVLMRAGGLVVESRDLSYDPDTGTARLARRHPESTRPDVRGPVKLWSEPTTDPAAPSLDLQGSSVELLYDVAASRLSLIERPEVILPEAQLTGREIVMSLGAGGGSIESIDAGGGARAQWWRNGDEASGETDSLEAETISVALAGGTPQGLAATVQTPDMPRPRLGLADGELRADRLEVAFVSGAPSAMTASGQAFFIPAAEDAGLVHIGADDLVLAAGGSGNLVANGNVEILLRPETPGGQGARFSGPRAGIVYGAGGVSEAEWPAGLRYRDPNGELDISAGYGVRDSENAEWVLRAAPEGDSPQPGRRPRLVAGEVDVAADVLRLADDGDVALQGAVAARLAGEAVRTVGPLFGDVPSVQAAADELAMRGGSNRLDFTGNARIWHEGGEQILRADEITLQPDIDDLQAKDNVFVSLVNPADPARGRAQDQMVTLTGRQLLVAGSPLQLVVAGNALLVLEGQGREIGGGRIEVLLDELGVWESLQVHERVVMTDPAGTGEGARLEYGVDTGVVTIWAAPGEQATFVNEQGFDMSDSRGLRLEWQDEELRVTAMQNGTTQTVRGGQR